MLAPGKTRIVDYTSELEYVKIMNWNIAQEHTAESAL
jgi:hypothetical protein